MASNIFPYSFGPQGRTISVDADGKIIAVSEAGQDSYIYGYGSTGRPLAVDASGRLIVSSLSNIIASSATSGSFSEDPWKSEGAVDSPAPNIIGDLKRYNGALYLAAGLSSASEGYLYKIVYSDGITSSNVFTTPKATSGYPQVLMPYRGDLYIGSSSGPSGYIWKADKTDAITLIGAVSGYNAAASNQIEQIYDMNVHDNRLTIGVRESPFGATEQPVFYYDGTNFGEVCRIKTNQASNTSSRLISFGNRLFTFRNQAKSIGIFDGVRTQYYFFNKALFGAAVYNNKLYFGATDGLYEWDDSEFALKQVDTGSSPWSVSTLGVYNGKLYFEERYIAPAVSGSIQSFDGASFKREYTIGTFFTSFTELNGRFFAADQVGNIHSYRAASKEALAHGIQDKTSQMFRSNKQYVKNLLEFTGNKYQERDAQGALVHVDTQKFPAYTSVRIIAQSDPLSSGVNKLDAKLGDQSMPPSGWTDDMPAGQYGDQFYHLESGYMRFGTSWEQQETPWPHHANFWFDTTPLPGELTTLTDALTYYRVVSQVAASGGQSVGHGITATASGVTITDSHSKGEYFVSYSMSFNGQNNSNVFGAIFQNEERQKSSQFERRLGSTDTGNVGGQTILDLEENDEVSFRIMSTSAGNPIRITTFNFVMHRLDKH
jgi:hypothetical protein